MMKVVLISAMLVVSASAFFGMSNPPGAQATQPQNNQVGNPPGVDMNRVMQMARQMLVLLLPKLLANPSLMSAFMAGNGPGKTPPFDPNSIATPVLSGPGNPGPPSGPSGPSGPGPMGPTGPTDPFGRQSPSGPMGRPNPSGGMGRPGPQGRPNPSGQFGRPSFDRPSKPMPQMPGGPMGGMPGMPSMGGGTGGGMPGGMMPGVKAPNPFAAQHVTNPYAAPPQPTPHVYPPASHHHMMYGMGDAYKDIRMMELLRDPIINLRSDPMLRNQLPPAGMAPHLFSFPDTLKEAIQMSLLRRQSTRPLTPKETQLMHLIGDPPGYKDMMRMGINPQASYGMGGGYGHGHAVARGTFG